MEVLPRVRSLLWRFGGFRDGGFKLVDENCCFGIFQFCIASVGAVLALMTACQTASTAQSMSQKEALLAQSGFKVITVTNPKQQQAVNGLAQGRCSAVTYNRKLYYVFPTGNKRQNLRRETSPIQRI